MRLNGKTTTAASMVPVVLIAAGCAAVMAGLGADGSEEVHVREISIMARQYGYAPHRIPDLRALGIDAYAFSLYKVYGPHCAALYCRAPEMAE